jgi:hypothetical protein
MRKLLCMLGFAFAGLASVWSQSTGSLPYNPANYVPEGYWLGIEEHVVHDGPVGGVDLTGYTTYRLYVHTLNELDFVSAVAGSQDYEFELSSTSSPAWFNDLVFGSNYGANINANLFAFIPSLQYDSWLTIGAETQVADFELMQATGNINPFTQFNAGVNVLVDDINGFALYTLFPESGSTAGPAFAGDDLKVLVAQITTQGEISGQFYIQVFQNGAQQSEFRGVMPISQNNPYLPTGDAGYDCTGACISDADGDGVCDGNEVLGCTDPVACNYEGATEENGTCTYPISVLVDCDGNCISDADGDGVCDLLEVGGCTDELACNFDQFATEDDGSCAFAAAGFDCNGDPYTCDNCFVSWTPSIADYEVQCMEEMPLTSDATVTATNCFGDALDVTSFFGEGLTPVARYAASTAYGDGEDGAFRIYGVDQHPALVDLGLSSFWFENGALELVEYNNGVAVLTGSIVNANDANATFDVLLTFIEGQNANDWTSKPSISSTPPKATSLERATSAVPT